MLARWARYDLIAIDEVGYVPLAEVGAEFLFQVIAERAEQAAVILTTNLPFSEWTQVIPNARLCKALLDRITDRAHIIETGTESYRFRRTLRPAQADRTAMPDAPSRNDGVTIACPVLRPRPFRPVGRRRFCSDACRQAAWRAPPADAAVAADPDRARPARPPSTSARPARPATSASSAARTAASSAVGSVPVVPAHTATSRSPSAISSAPETEVARPPDPTSGAAGRSARFARLPRLRSSGLASQRSSDQPTHRQTWRSER